MPQSIFLVLKKDFSIFPSAVFCLLSWNWDLGTIFPAVIRVFRPKKSEHSTLFPAVVCLCGLKNEIYQHYFLPQLLLVVSKCDLLPIFRAVLGDCHPKMRHVNDIWCRKIGTFRPKNAIVQTFFPNVTGICRPKRRYCMH